MIEITLPPAISSNRYWRPVRIGQHITIVPTKEAKDYRNVVAKIASAVCYSTLKGRLSMEIDLYPHRPQDWQKRQRQFGQAWDDTVQCIDLGNVEKVLSDALQGVVFENDKQLWRILLNRMEPDADGERVVVRIAQLVVDCPTQMEIAA